MEKQELRERGGKQEQGRQSHDREQSASHKARPSPGHVPVQAALRPEVLRAGKALGELSPTLLQELAALLGNSVMTQLLEGGGGGPETLEYPLPETPAPEREANAIHTCPPLLCPAQISLRGGPPPPSAAPGRIRERVGSDPVPGSFGMY